MAKQDTKIYSYVPKLIEQVKAGKIDRREFLWTATLLGLSATSAYGVLGLTDPFDKPAEAAPVPGSIYRMAMRVPALENPATYSWAYDSLSARLVCDYLTRTGADNVTRPWLLEKWDASEDIKTWTLHLKPGIKWSNGDPLVADHIIWNIKRWVDPKVGSSILGLMASYMTVDVETGEKDATGKPKMTKKIWSDNAVEKIDDLDGPDQLPRAAARRARASLPLSGADPAPERERQVRQGQHRHRALFDGRVRGRQESRGQGAPGLLGQARCDRDDRGHRSRR